MDPIKTTAKNVWASCNVSLFGGRIRIRGSMSLTSGSVSRILDPDPAIFDIDLQDANKKQFKKKFFCLLLSEGIHLHHFSKIKSPKEVTKQ